MRLQEPHPGLYEATLSAQEISMLLAGARMALNVLEAGPEEGPSEASTALRRVLADFDGAVHRLHRKAPAEQVRPP